MTRGQVKEIIYIDVKDEGYSQTMQEEERVHEQARLGKESSLITQRRLEERPSFSAFHLNLSRAPEY
jgi:hypothetical protein